MSHINLLPWREKAKQKRKRDFGLILACCVLIVGVLGLGVQRYYVYQQQQQEKRNQILNGEMVRIDRQLAEIRTIREEKKNLKARIALIQTLQQSRNIPTHLFNDIPVLIPSGVYLERLSLSDKTVNIDGKSETNSRIARFMRQVEVSSWLTIPSISSIVTLNEGSIPLSKFQLKFDLIPEGKESNKEGG